jgi:hypothetical protein
MLWNGLRDFLGEGTGMILLIRQGDLQIVH